MSNMWSEYLQNLTRNEVFVGAVMKDLNHNYGVFTGDFPVEGKVSIMGKKDIDGLPAPDTTVIATFNSVDDMVAAGWVMD